MKVWATSFIVLFGLVELYQWVRHLHFGVDLPLPVFILGGALLAIASNYDKRAGLPFGFRPEESGTTGAIANQSSTQALQSSTANPVAFSNAQLIQKPELPPLNSSTQSPQPQKPISFTIQRPKQM